MTKTSMPRMFQLGALLTLIAAAGCGGARPIDTGADADAGADLAGRWRSACVDPGTGQALRLTFDLTATTWALDYESFGDAVCAAPMLAVRIEGPYELGGPSQAVVGAREGRFGFARKTVTPLAQGAADFLAQACGGGTYEVGKPADLAAGCAGLGAYPIAACAWDYDIVKRDGDRLYFGARPADNNMCSPDRRPTALSPVALSPAPR